MNTDKSLRGSLNFMTFTTTLLMKKRPTSLTRGELVIQIDDSVIIHPLAMHMVQQYAKEGYQVAVNDPVCPALSGNPGPDRLHKAEHPDHAGADAENIIDIAHSMKKAVYRRGIDREETYQKAVKLGVDALRAPLCGGKADHTDPQQRLFAEQLLPPDGGDDADEPDVEEIEQIISVDATLTHGLLRMANSCYYALRHR